MQDVAPTFATFVDRSCLLINPIFISTQGRARDAYSRITTGTRITEGYLNSSNLRVMMMTMRLLLSVMFDSMYHLFLARLSVDLAPVGQERAMNASHTDLLERISHFVAHNLESRLNSRQYRDTSGRCPSASPPHCADRSAQTDGCHSRTRSAPAEAQDER